MKEWNSPYNPFNSMKVLIWSKHLEGMAKQDFLPPVQVDTDPSNRCQFDCIWCNAFLNMKKSDAVMTEEHLLKLADFYAEWGVKSTCIAGGGEPLMNKGMKNFLLRLKKNGVEAGIITNGVLLNEELNEIIAETCRWIGISIDAGTNNTYMTVKGISNNNIFQKVINNISNLTSIVKKEQSECDVAYKYLLHPINAKEIFIAAQLAKSIGVKDFHLRPVGWDNIMKTLKKDPIDFTPTLEDIDKQTEECMKLEDENFHFYGIRHKFRPNFQRKVNFSQCWAAPLVLTFGADGNCHLCFDLRGREDLILCKHSSDPREVLKHWNSDRHKKILQNIKVENCPRCTFGPYNEIVEKVFVKDGMCKNFP
jgi:MoaA/NifB/PqqE/SkfB family radical SAM enzyme